MRWIAVVLACLTMVVLQPVGTGAGWLGETQEDDQPELSLRASPRVAFVPVEVLFVAELRGGADDYEDLYCVSVEWDWDDDTRSESTPDCDPYEPGTSKIRRRYSARHRFDYGGRYEVRINLKKRGDVIASARTNIELRGGRF